MRHYTRYIFARFVGWTREQAYRNYIADSLQALSETIAEKLGGSYYKTRLCDILDPPPEETRTGEEIIEMMLVKLKGGAYESP